MTPAGEFTTRHRPMFPNLTERFQTVFRNLRGRGVIAATHLAEANAGLRAALLAADVHHDVVAKFLVAVEAAAIGREVTQGLQPVEQYLRIVHEELTRVLGGAARSLTLSGKPPVVILCVGLQGSGKTTTVAKLGAWWKRQGRRPLCIAADLARPAAVGQLQTLAGEAGIRVALPVPGRSVVAVVEDGLAAARAQMCDIVLIDTAGRLHIDAALMQELAAVARVARPVQTLLAVDAMAGQEGLAAARGFHEVVPLSGMLLTKADGDARGGVALSCVAVIGAPIFFVGTGERLDALEPFHPDRMAARILDLGDLATLAEQVGAAVDQGQAARRMQTLAKGKWTLEDYRDQLKESTKLGQWEKMLGMLPGAHQLMQQVDMERVKLEVRRKLAVIDSMTPKERCNIKLLNGSRRRRIAAGSGTTVPDVNRLVKEFETLQIMMKRGNPAARRDYGSPYSLKSGRETEVRLLSRRRDR